MEGYDCQDLLAHGLGLGGGAAVSGSKSVHLRKKGRGCDGGGCCGGGGVGGGGGGL